MREVLLLAIHLLVTLARLLRPGGIRAVAAESLLLKHQILIGNRARRRAPNLTTVDRVVLGLTTLFVNPRRIPKLGALIKPATLFKFHRALVDQKYRLLFSSSGNRRTPGPKGPSPEVMAAIVEMKHRNPRFGCVRIAQQIAEELIEGVNRIDASRSTPVLTTLRAQHVVAASKGNATAKALQSVAGKNLGHPKVA